MAHFAFLMDPLDSLALKKDSTLAMIRAAQLRGHAVSYFTLADMSYMGGRTVASARKLHLRDDFAASLDYTIAGRDWYTLGDPARTDLATFDVVMMRKDPPFDMEYVYATYFLERAAELGAMVVNNPRSLRDCNEKFFATAFPECGPPLIVSRSMDVIRDFHAEHSDVVLKKLDGMGGMNIFRVRADDPNLNVILETLTRHETELVMAQRYLPAIRDGDKRILMIDGQPVPYCLARIPKSGESRGNLAAGGTGEGRPLTARDREIAETVGPELVRRGLTFVGLDVIGDHLTEVNVTCPTCIRELDAQFGLDIAGTLIETLVRKLGN
ncbi:MAG: glutathione synthase [Gammaproteobacteria bacterium]|nr:glutathione synthase [Gammaproteobacteria bacterium]